MHTIINTCLGTMCRRAAMVCHMLDPAQLLPLQHGHPVNCPMPTCCTAATCCLFRWPPAMGVHARTGSWTQEGGSGRSMRRNCVWKLYPVGVR
jgi:hypothetical protein